MNHRIVPIALFAAAICISGCKDTSPGGVCKHIGSLAEKDGKDEPSEKKRKNCEKKVGKVKDELGDSYDKWAKCVLDLDNFDDARGKKKCNPKDFK